MAVPKTDRNKADIVGEVTGAPVARRFDSGTRLLSFSVRTRTGGSDSQTTNSVPVAWWDPSGKVQEGQRVRVVGHVHRRFYKTPSGLRSAVEVVAESVET